MKSPFYRPCLGPLLTLFLILMTGCNPQDEKQVSPSNDGPYQGQLSHTLLMGTADNAEVIQAIEGTNRAILVSSKARKISLLEVDAGEIKILQEKALFQEDASESELTHIDINSTGTWAVLTRTILEVADDGAQTSCGGELIFVDATATESFGQILATLPVGPMPDSVDISDNDGHVVSANERDGPEAWGKCEVPDAMPSISVVDVQGGPSEAIEIARIEMIDAGTGPREPEDVCFSKDHDLVAVTLQDSHEVALFRISEIQEVTDPTSDDLWIVSLPENALGALPWPDGITSFQAQDGEEFFAVAGEWNDTLLLIDIQGNVVANIPVSPQEIPEHFPRMEDEGSPLFSPDSLAAFIRGQRSYLGATLRHSGVIALWDVSEAPEVSFTMAIPVGKNEAGGADEDGSTIRPEGITAAEDGSFILVANEEESSVSLVLPIP